MKFLINLFLKHLNSRTVLIRHFHIVYNVRCLPQNFCISIVFNFSWDDCKK